MSTVCCVRPLSSRCCCRLLDSFLHQTTTQLDLNSFLHVISRNDRSHANRLKYACKLSFLVGSKCSSWTVPWQPALSHRLAQTFIPITKTKVSTPDEHEVPLEIMIVLQSLQKVSLPSVSNNALPRQLTPSLKAVCTLGFSRKEPKSCTLSLKDWRLGTSSAYKG